MSDPSSHDPKRVPPSSAHSERRAGRQKSAAKHQAILEAAVRLFLSQGLRKTSLDAVARDAKVSKQTVYSHFADKDDLFRAVIVRKVSSYHFDAGVEPVAGAAAEALHELGTRMLSLLADPQVIAMMRVVSAESPTHPRIAQLFYESGPERATRTIEGTLIRLHERGELAIPNAREAAIDFLSLLKGEHHFRMLMGVAQPLDAATRNHHIARIVARFMRAYATSA